MKLSVVCNALSTVKDKLYQIGVQLGIMRDKIKEFTKEDDPLSALVDYWLRGNVKDVEVSWNSLVEALKSGHVDELGLAHRIEQTYIHEVKGDICDEGG